ncbi:MAG TPA: hypothetical protein VFI75_00980 [Candidatus Acidoferrum sp.]|nr:hypothetical protein [Candidatus Acidoferrum sp.]
MRIFVILLSFFLASEGSAMTFQEYIVPSVPTDRSTLKGGAWFPYVISKVAPLEWWSYQEAISDVRREQYRSDSRYQLARQNTWEFPRFCFSMFRPSEESFRALLNAVNDYEGAVAWVMHDDCIGAFRVKPTGQGMVRLPYAMSEQEIEKHNQALRQPPDAAFIEKAVADIPVFCSYLESRLGQKGRDPQQFDPRWLTAEGLAHSKGEFEDFLEPGTWSVFLARDPDAYAKTFKPTSPADRSLGLSMTMSQEDDLFKELGAKWNSQDAAPEEGPIVPGFPLLSRLSDFTSDATYEPNEVASFLLELRRAQQIVKEPRSIRGLDNLIRIARWAQEWNLGIYFGGV